jgi:hypothetical protein
MRRTKDIIIDQEGRDKGKHFFITEMPAAQAERWAMRAILALSTAGFQVPEDMQHAGMAAIAVAGLNALNHVSFADFTILMDEMMSCVQYVTSENPRVVRSLVSDDDIEEVLTRAYLKAEVFGLHTGFNLADAISASVASAMTPKTSPPTRTSRRRLQRSSARVA